MKFNISFKAKDTVVNHEGAKAFTLSPEMELYAAIATTMLSDASYETADKRMERIVSLIQQVKPEFAAKLAVYARKKMNLRTAPVLLAKYEAASFYFISRQIQLLSHFLHPSVVLNLHYV